MGQLVFAGVGALMVFLALKDGSVQWGMPSAGGKVRTREEDPGYFWFYVVLLSFISLYFLIAGLTAIRAEPKRTATPRVPHALFVLR